MKFFIFSIVFIYPLVLSAQIDVFDCNAYQAPSQQDVLNASPNFYRGCIRFENQNYNFGGTTNMSVTSASTIEMMPGFESGAYTGSGQMDYYITSGPTFPVMLMNYTSLYNIGRYKKMELGITLPEPYNTYVNNFIAKQNNPNLNFPTNQIINPFLEWNLDIEAHYYHKDGWKVLKSDGFFYRDMQRNNTTDLWDEVATPYNFRIRFAPPEIGNWSAVIKIKVNGVLVASSPDFQFYVTEQSHPGYVTVHANKRNFQRDGQMIYPVGQNFIAEIPFCNNYGTDPNTSHVASNVSCWKEYLGLISNYGKLGGKYIRVFESPRFSLLEWEEKGNYFKRMHYACETDNLLDTMEKYDILCIYNLMLQTPFSNYANYDDWPNDWDHWQRSGTSFYYNYGEGTHINPYNDNPGPNGKQPHEMFLNESDLKYHQQRTRYVVSRYGYSTQIYMYEPLSESFHLDEFSGSGNEPPYLNVNHPQHAVVQQAVNKYVTRIAHFIKDSMEHSQQLLGLNAAMGAWNPTTLLANHDSSVFNGVFDAVGINYYASIPDRLYIDNQNQLPLEIEHFSQGRNRPVYFSESGHLDNCNALTETNGSVEIMDNMEFGFLGLAGFNLWHTIAGNQNNLWQMQVRAKNHMNAHTKDVLSAMNGSWNQNSQRTALTNDESFLKENFYYVSENKEKASGVIKNRTFNLINEINPSSFCYLSNPHQGSYYNKIDLNWTDGNPVKIEELKTNTNYIIEYYSYQNGDYLGYECQGTGLFGNSLVLHHPTLYYNTGMNPIVWYIVYQYNCKKGIDQIITSSRETDNLLEKGLNVEENQQETIQIYPNPVDDAINIISLEEFEYTITDLSGKVLVNGKGNTKNNRIILSSLSSGSYILTVRTISETMDQIIIIR